MKTWIGLLVAIFGSVSAFFGCMGAGLGVFDGSVAEALKLGQQVLKLVPPPGTEFSAGHGISFTLTDTLGPGQVAETANVTFAQLGTGTFSINRENPNAELAGRAPAPGFYSYSLSVRTVLASSKTVSCKGEGSVLLVNGGRYSLAADYRNICVATLTRDN